MYLRVFVFLDFFLVFDQFGYYISIMKLQSLLNGVVYQLGLVGLVVIGLMSLGFILSYIVKDEVVFYRVYVYCIYSGCIFL